MTDALASLQKALTSGLLQFIRLDHACQEGLFAHTARTPEEQAACDTFVAETGFTLKHPRHFRVSPIVAVGDPDERGVCKAKAEDGSLIFGTPEALLARLMEYALAG